MPEIRKVLTVSASHLPEAFEQRLREQAQIGRGLGREHSFWPFAGEYGVLLYAPTKAEADEDFEDPDIPESLARLLVHASPDLGCSFVLFDVDGGVLDGFDTFEPTRDEANEDEPDRFVNHYRCPPEDGGCGHEWTDTSPCTNNDHCPVCDRGDIEPYKSEVL